MLVTIHHDNDSINKFFDKKDFFEDSLTTNAMRIMDDCAREYFIFLDLVEDQINTLEDRMLTSHKDTVKEIFTYKKTLIYFHKSLNANLEAIRRLEKQVKGDSLTVLRYLHDDIFQLIDMSATYRDLLTGTLEVHLSTINTNMNRIMKRMTAWTTLILLPTFFTGLYGMNFQFMPEITWKYGYIFAWGLILGSILFLLIYFRKKGWF